MIRKLQTGRLGAMTFLVAILIAPASANADSFANAELSWTVDTTFASPTEARYDVSGTVGFVIGSERFPSIPALGTPIDINLGIKELESTRGRR